MNHHHPSSFLTGVLLGAVAGAITGLLLAPKSGRETRQQLKRNAQQARVRADLLVKEGGDLLDEAKDKAKDLKGKFHHAQYVTKERVEDLKDSMKHA